MNKTTKVTIGDKFREKYPDQIPIVVHYNDVSFLNGIAPKKTSQLLVPSNTTLGYLIIIIRRHGKIAYNEPLVMAINRVGNIASSSTEGLTDIYHKHKDADDGCLHIYVEKDTKPY